MREFIRHLQAFVASSKEHRLLKFAEPIPSSAELPDELKDYAQRVSRVLNSPNDRNSIFRDAQTVRSSVSQYLSEFREDTAKLDQLRIQIQGLVGKTRANDGMPTIVNDSQLMEFVEEAGLLSTTTIADLRARQALQSAMSDAPRSQRERRERLSDKRYGVGSIVSVTNLGQNPIYRRAGWPLGSFYVQCTVDGAQHSSIDPSSWAVMTDTIKSPEQRRAEQSALEAEYAARRREERRALGESVRMTSEWHRSMGHTGEFERTVSAGRRQMGLSREEVRAMKSAGRRGRNIGTPGSPEHIAQLESYEAQRSEWFNDRMGVNLHRAAPIDMANLSVLLRAEFGDAYQLNRSSTVTTITNSNGSIEIIASTEELPDGAPVRVYRAYNKRARTSTVCRTPEDVKAVLRDPSFIDHVQGGRVAHGNPDIEKVIREEPIEKTFFIESRFAPREILVSIPADVSGTPAPLTLIMQREADGSFIHKNEAHRALAERAGITFRRENNGDIGITLRQSGGYTVMYEGMGGRTYGPFTVRGPNVERARAAAEPISTSAPEAAAEELPEDVRKMKEEYTDLLKELKSKKLPMADFPKLAKEIGRLFRSKNLDAARSKLQEGINHMKAILEMPEPIQEKMKTYAATWRELKALDSDYALELRKEAKIINEMIYSRKYDKAEEKLTVDEVDMRLRIAQLLR